MEPAGQEPTQEPDAVEIGADVTDPAPSAPARPARRGLLERVLVPTLALVLAALVGAMSWDLWLRPAVAGGAPAAPTAPTVIGTAPAAPGSGTARPSARGSAPGGTGTKTPKAAGSKTPRTTKARPTTPTGQPSPTAPTPSGSATDPGTAR